MNLFIPAAAELFPRFGGPKRHSSLYGFDLSSSLALKIWKLLDKRYLLNSEGDIEVSQALDMRTRACSSVSRDLSSGTDSLVSCIGLACGGADVLSMTLSSAVLDSSDEDG